MKNKIKGKMLASALALACMLNVSFIPHTIYAADPTQRFEFEDGSHPDSAVENDSKASGGKYVFLKDNSESISVDVEAPETGMYDIIICYSAPYGEKIQTLLINGIDQGQISLTSADWTEVKVLSAKLNEGKNEITIKGSWGWTNFDYVRYEQAVLPDITKYDRELCDPDATDSAKSLMAYLADVYGNNIISGQQEIYSGGPHTFEHEFDYIKNTTGKLPAIRGFDLMNSANPLYGNDDGTISRAIDWVNTKGGIATSSWHITVPKDFAGYTVGNRVDWSQTTYEPDKTDFDTSKVITEGTKENKYYMLCLELLAEQIAKLQDADVPLIFRPLHEAEGGGGETKSWFWWGKSGSKVYKELWKLTYKTLTEEYNLHNIIWEWNSYAYETSADWYPGDEYVDLIAYDKYNCTDWSTGNAVLIHNDSAISGTFYSIVEKYNGKKMVAMAENDSIPTLSNLLGEKAAWLYFCPWYDGGSDNINFLSNPVFNKAEDLKEIYQSDYCITLDELPDLKKYTSGTVTPTKPTESTEQTDTTEPTNTTEPTESITAPTESSETETGITTSQTSEITSGTTTSKKTTSATTKKTTKPTTAKTTKPTESKTTQEPPVEADYAGTAEYDNSPLKVGEKRAVRVYNPETGETAGLVFEDIQSDKYSIEYTEGSDTFYITALAPGEVTIGLRELTCPFVTYVHITIVEDSGEETTKSTTALTTDKTETTQKTKPTSDNSGETTVSKSETTAKTTASKNTTTKSTTTKASTTKSSTTKKTVPTATVATNEYAVPENVKATMYGDVNTDGTVNVSDLVCLNMFLLNNKKYPLTDVQTANADCAKNGIINISDSTILMNYVAMFIDISGLGK